MRHHSQRAKQKWNKRIPDQMLDAVTIADDGDDACGASQGVILVVLNQFLKAFGTNYFLRVIPTKWHFFDLFSDMLSGICTLFHIAKDQPEIARVSLCFEPQGLKVKKWGSPHVCNVVCSSHLLHFSFCVFPFMATVVWEFRKCFFSFLLWRLSFNSSYNT